MICHCIRAGKQLRTKNLLSTTRILNTVSFKRCYFGLFTSHKEEKQYQGQSWAIWELRTGAKTPRLGTAVRQRPRHQLQALVNLLSPDPPAGRGAEADDNNALPAWSPSCLSRGAAIQEPDPFACVGFPSRSPCLLWRLYVLFQLSFTSGMLHSPHSSLSAQHRGQCTHHVNGNILF